MARTSEQLQEGYRYLNVQVYIYTVGSVQGMCTSKIDDKFIEITLQKTMCVCVCVCE